MSFNTQNNLSKLKNALTSIQGLSVYHYRHPSGISPPYIVWAEDGEGDSLHTGNHKAQQVITGTIDYFTKNEFDQTIDSIQNALNTVENLGWQLESVQYEDETNLIHYEWIFEVA